MTKIYGHRGAKGTYPENTLLSFKKAIEQGVDGLELDVHLTKDQEVVVIHDETLDRTTNGHGWIKDLTLEEIKRVSAGSRFTHFPLYEKDWDLEQIPTLQEVLELLDPYSIELNIELKTSEVQYEGIESKVNALVKRFGGSRKVVYSSFHLPTIMRMKKIDPNAEVAWLLYEGISQPEDYIHSLGLEALHLSRNAVLPNGGELGLIIKKISESNIEIPKEVMQFAEKYSQSPYSDALKNLYDKVRVWTVNNPEEMASLLDLNVNTIITDFPEMALTLRDEKKRIMHSKVG